MLKQLAKAQESLSHTLPQLIKPWTEGVMRLELSLNLNPETHA